MTHQHSPDQAYGVVGGALRGGGYGAAIGGLTGLGLGAAVQGGDLAEAAEGGATLGLYGGALTGALAGAAGWSRPEEPHTREAYLHGKHAALVYVGLTEKTAQTAFGTGTDIETDVFDYTQGDDSFPQQDKDTYRRYRRENDPFQRERQSGEAHWQQGRKPLLQQFSDWRSTKPQAPAQVQKAYNAVTGAAKYSPGALLQKGIKGIEPYTEKAKEAIRLNRGAAESRLGTVTPKLTALPNAVSNTVGNAFGALKGRLGVGAPNPPTPATQTPVR